MIHKLCAGLACKACRIEGMATLSTLASMMIRAVPRHRPASPSRCGIEAEPAPASPGGPALRLAWVISSSTVIPTPIAVSRSAYILVCRLDNRPSEVGVVGRHVGGRLGPDGTKSTMHQAI